MNNSEEEIEEGMIARVVTYNCKYCLQWRKRVNVYSHLLIDVGYRSQYSNLLWVGWSGVWTQVEARFSGSIQMCPETHPAACTMGIRSPGLAWSYQGMALTTHPLLAPGSSTGQAIPLNLPSVPAWHVMVPLYLFLVLTPVVAQTMYHSPGGTIGREENPQDGLCSSQDLNKVPSEYNL